MHTYIYFSARPIDKIVSFMASGPVIGYLSVNVGTLPDLMVEIAARQVDALLVQLYERKGIFAKLDHYLFPIDG